MTNESQFVIGDDDFLAASRPYYEIRKNSMLGDISSTHGIVMSWVKKYGFDYIIKIYWSILSNIFSSGNSAIEDIDLCFLFEVRNKAVIDNLNAVLSRSLDKGYRCLVLVNDPGLIKYIEPPCEAVNIYSYMSNARLVKEAWFPRKSRLRRLYISLLGAERDLDDRFRFRYFYNLAISIAVESACLESFLSRVRPRWIVMGSDALKLGRLASIRARRYGSRSITIQHGVVAGTSGYLPLYSDYIAVWGEFTRRWFKEQGVAGERILVTGNPRYHYNDVLPRRQAGTERKIVVLTNPVKASINMHLLEIVLPVSVELDLPVKHKPHPSENISIYSKFSGGNYTLLDSHISINDVVSPGDVVVTMNSSAGIEALMLGALLLDFEYDPVIEQKAGLIRIPYNKYGVAYRFSNSTQLMSSLEKILLQEQESVESNIHNFLRDYIGPANQDPSGILLSKIEELS